MSTSSSGHKEILGSILSLALDNPDKIQAAGSRLMDRIRKRQEEEVLRRRLSICREIQILDRARERASCVDKDETEDELRDPTLNRTDQWVYAGEVAALREYNSKYGDLDQVTAIEASARFYADKYQEGQREQGEELSPREVLIEERRASLDPTHVEIATHRAPFQLVLEALEFMRDAGGGDSWTGDQWWEAAAVILATDSEDISASDLGIDEELPLGGWGETGDDIFNHRDGMRAFMSRIPWDPLYAENDAAFWSLASRTRAQLEAATTHRSGAPESKPTVTHAEDSPGRDEHSDATFIRRGESWHIAFGSEEDFLTSSLGLSVIHQLLENPGTGIPAEKLYARARGLSDAPAFGAGKAMDKDGMDELRLELERLLKERRLADDGDDQTLSRIDADTRLIESELAGGERSLSPDTKAITRNVGKAIKRDLLKIRRKCPVLADHLGRSILHPHSARPGYSPPGSQELVWLL